MKVMHVIDSGGLYGAEVMLLNLMEEQRKQGVEPLLCSIGEPRIDDKAIETETELREISLRRLRMRKGLNLIGALKIIRVAREENADIIHTHGYKPNILLGCLPRRMRQLPTVATLHGWTSLKTISRLGVYQWLDAYMLRRADAVVTVSRAIHQHRLFRHVRAKHLSVIANGIPLCERVDSGTTAEPAILEFCQKGFIVGSIGRLSPEKGYVYLLRAISHLRTRDVPAKVIIIGDGNERDELMLEIKRLGLCEYAILPGYQENAARYIALFDAFALPSLTEGLPMVLLEAMARYTPVVATRVGGIPDLISDKISGLLVPPHSPDTLADVLYTLYRDADLAAAVSQQAYCIVRQQYSSAQMTLRYRAVYDLVTCRQTNTAN